MAVSRHEISAIPAASRSTILIDNPGYRMVRHDPLPELAQAGKRLVITFGTLQSDIEDVGFGTAFALKNGHPTIYVSPRRGSQYQELSLDAFFETIVPEIGEQRPVVYGSSLGAYAAVYFGGSIDADIIAAAPQCPAMPELQMPHAQTTPMRHIDLTEVPRTSGKVVTLWDPHERPDSILVNDFIKVIYPDAHYLTFDYAGHKVLDTMSRNGVLQNFIRPLLHDNTLTEVSMPTEGNPIWHCNLGKELSRSGRLAEALEQLNRSFALQPSSENIQLLAKIFARHQMVDEAKGLFACIDTDPAIKRMTFGPARRDLAAVLGHAV